MAGKKFLLSPLFLTVLATLALAAIAMIWRVRERKHHKREDSLQVAVRQRTSQLEAERLAEKARNRVLEMLVSNEPLEPVLDATVRLIESQIPGIHAAVLLGRAGHFKVGAAPELPLEWLTAMAAPYAIPFEVWQRTLLHRNVKSHPAWKAFNAACKAGPAAISSTPIGGPDAQLGALILCYPHGTEPAEQDLRFAGAAVHLTRLAIEHRRLYDNLQFEAHHDSLTTLPNRILFEEQLDRRLRESVLEGKCLAVFFIDLDGFKQVNDSFSHRIGDLFLREIADQMKHAMRPGDTIARMGGDEFTVLAAGIAGSAESEAIGERLLRAVRRPVVIEGHQLNGSASIGFALYPDDGAHAEQLLRDADAAMYSAKERGGGCIQAFAACNPDLDRARMGDEVRLALQNDYFVVHYQPKVGRDGNLAGLEALVRMNHPRHGQIPPDRFIQVAESNGLIVPLGSWVLDEVCRQSAEWRSRGLGQIPVSVNVSPVQISRPEFAQTVRDCLARHAVPAWSIELELTESLLLQGATGTREGLEANDQMQALRRQGIRFSIDDFGTGYSSLSYLHRLQVDAIKLDKSFIHSIDTDALACTLVKAIIGVAEGLKLAVIAEGVETWAQRAALISAGCQFMQGFLFARPMPPTEVEPLLVRGAMESVELLQLANSLQPEEALELGR